MKSKVFFKAFMALFLGFVVFNSCKDGGGEGYINPSESSNQYQVPAVTFSATVQGFVLDEKGKAVYAAEVKTGNKTTTTDKNGYFKIDGAPFTGDFCYINAVKKGFFSGSTTIHGKAGKEYATQLFVTAQNNIVSFAAAQGKTITLQGGAEVKLAPGGFVTSTGKAYTGNVNVAVMHIDPAAKNFSSLIPGGDLRGFDANNKNVQLYSYGMLNVEMSDDVGNPLQLAQNSKATLTMPVPASMTGTAPATIPLWYFDENKGVWIEEGKATLQGAKYVGTVSHFTPWNIDVPGPRAKIKGRVVDSEGNAPLFSSIKVGQIIITADNEGYFEVVVPAGTSIDINVFDQMDGIEMSSSTTVVEPLQADQIKEIGDIVLVGISTVKAFVTNCNGAPISGYVFVGTGSSYTRRALYVDGICRFSSKTAGISDVATFYTSDYNYKAEKYFTMPPLHQTFDLGTIAICGKNIESSISFTYKIGNQPPINVSYDIPPEANYVGGNPYKNIIFSDRTRFITPSYDVFFSFIGEDKPGTIILGAQNFNFIWGLYSSGITESMLKGTNIELVLTKVGNVGQEVLGTFSGQGTFYKGGVPQAATVTNGKFITVRTH